MHNRFFSHLSLNIKKVIVILAGILLVCYAVSLIKSSSSEFTIWHVDAKHGSNDETGKSQSKAFATIQHATNLAQPGDTIRIYPGVYSEHLTLKRPGTAEKPIRIMADRIQKNRVILTGADMTIRNGQRNWESVDPELCLYRIPLNHMPVRVLADHVDLLLYTSLDDLKAFRFLKSDYPGHLHGFAWDEQEKMLYVRLRADCLYNHSTNPNELTMAVAPPTGGGKFGHIQNRGDNYNINIPFQGSAWIIIDGITFETPGIAGVYTQADDVIVRNSWFYGCRAGVAAPEDNDATLHANCVTVENCFYTHFPAFSDAMETIEREGAIQRSRKEFYQRLMYWQRKGNFPPGDGVGSAYGYEVGLTVCMGKDWLIRNNHIYEAMEGISAAGNRFSQDTTIISNRFERICDNAVEAEQHAQNLVVASNLIIDTFEPFSWQPQSGAPLPGPVYIYDNVVWQTPENTRLWEIAGCWPGVVKVGNKDPHWIKLFEQPQLVTIPDGMWVVHNTFITPRGRLLTYLNTKNWPMDNLFFINNIMCMWRLIPPSQGTYIDHISFENNLVWPSMPLDDGTIDRNLPQAAGKHGIWSSETEIPENWHTALKDKELQIGLTNGVIMQTITELTFRQQIGAAPLSLTVGPQPRSK